MPMYTTQTITRAPEGDGYSYTDWISRTAKSMRDAVRMHVASLPEPRAKEVCVLATDPGVPNHYGEVFICKRDEVEDGEYVVRRAVTRDARRIARELLKLFDEIENLSISDATSLAMLLESIEIDCSVTGLEECFPASYEFTANLNVTDALDGVRLLIHGSHDLPYRDHSDVEKGGFLPIDGEE